jgi:hypothetical protein
VSHRNQRVSAQVAVCDELPRFNRNQPAYTKAWLYLRCGSTCKVTYDFAACSTSQWHFKLNAADVSALEKVRVFVSLVPADFAFGLHSF